MKTGEIEGHVFPGDHVFVVLLSGREIEGFVCDVEFSDDFDGASDRVYIDAEDGIYSIEFREIESVSK